jgi:hypothetical protein
MENTQPSDSETEAGKLRHAPHDVGNAIVEGTRTLLHEGAKLLEEAGSALVDATRSVAHPSEGTDEAHLGDAPTPSATGAPSPAPVNVTAAPQTPV